MINKAIIVLMFGISGCSSNSHEAANELPLTQEPPIVFANNADEAVNQNAHPHLHQPQYLQQETLNLNFHTHQMVSDFTERLAHELMQKHRKTSWEGLIAIASFVNFDDTLQETNALGNLISENLLVEVQRYDVPVLDVHMKGWLNINNTGDYVFSRDASEIVFNNNIKYVLAGVMIRVERGVKVNARIVELSSQQVMSTGSVLIPNYLVNSL